MKGLWFSVWAASFIALGLLMAYVDGISLRGIIGSAGIMSLLIAGVVASSFVFSALKRRRPPER